MLNFENFINLNKLLEWSFSHGLRIVFIAIGTIVIFQIAKIFIKRAIKIVTEKTYAIRDGEAMEKRNETLIGVLLTSIKAVITIFAGLMILSELGINIGPLLAGAGIAGLAIGFGAQSLVKDVISGLFILLEDQYRKGDVVKIADTAGLVEDVNLRRTVLRDLDGIQHHIPNGEISKASNLTKSWSRVNLDIPVAYDTDIDKVIDVLNRVGKSLAEDSHFSSFILKPPQVWGVDDFGESEIKIKIVGDTKPLKQWDVARELRRRIKRAFDKEGISIPFPQRDVHIYQHQVEKKN